MKLPMAGLVVLATVTANAAEFQQTTPRKVSNINEKTLLANVWPGMTIKQTIQILGEPEEVMKVRFSNNESAPALRYGVYWLIPPLNGVQVECIIHQKGLKAYDTGVLTCDEIQKEHILRKQ